MEFKIENKLFLPALTAVAKMINSKCAMPIMKDFLFRCEDGVVSVTATDGESTVEKKLPILTLDGSGSFCIDHKSLLDLLKKMGQKMVTITANHGVISVRHNSGSYEFPADNTEDFPVKTVFEAEGRYSLQAKDIINGINHTIMSVSEDTIRPMLCGILIDIVPGSVVFVSSDTHILSKFTISGYDFTETRSGILPSKVAKILNSLLTSEESVTLKLSQTRMEFECDNFTLSTVTLKGMYPAYNRVIPQIGGTEIIIDREELKSSLARLETCSDNEYSTIKMNVDMAGVILRTSNNNYRINANETIVADVSGSDICIAYASGYMRRWLDVAANPKVKLNITDPSRPIVLREGEDSQNTEWVSVVMPLMLNEAN